MSRIGKLPIIIPEAVTVSIDDNTVTVKGPKGSISRHFDKAVNLKIEDGVLLVTPADDSRFAAAMHGTVRSVIFALIQGIQKPFSKDLEIHGVGLRAQLAGNILSLNLGFSHVINFVIPQGITITMADPTKIKVEGVDKQLVGQVAARIKSYRKVEPYKGKGVRILGEFIRRKEGKKSARSEERRVGKECRL